MRNNEIQLKKKPYIPYIHQNNNEFVSLIHTLTIILSFTRLQHMAISIGSYPIFKSNSMGLHIPYSYLNLH